MYINPFFAGVLAVVLAEAVALFLVGVMSAKKKK